MCRSFRERDEDRRCLETSHLRKKTYDRETAVEARSPKNWFIRIPVCFFVWVRGKGAVPKTNEQTNPETNKPWADQAVVEDLEAVGVALAAAFRAVARAATRRITHRAIRLITATRRRLFITTQLRHITHRRRLARTTRRRQPRTLLTVPEPLLRFPFRQLPLNRKSLPGQRGHRT